MKTDDLIALLASQAPPVDRRAPVRRFALAWIAGFVAALLLMVALLGVRPDIEEAMAMPTFWFRLCYASAIAAAALWVTARLARPGVRVGGAWAVLATPVALGWVAMGWVLAHAAPGTHLPLILGHTWRVCPILIATLAMPAFIAMLWAVRGMAPVRPRLAGAAVGLLAGATGTVAYCLHCPEMAPPFWSTWYLLGMLIPAALGVLVGPRSLRW
jgi:hypothetical protein